jgi:polyhydroxyalkanoate synthase
VRYALRQGVQVFIVSWRNVGRELSTLTWEDYIAQGVPAPLEVIAKITRADRINTLGFCVGGTLLASYLRNAYPENNLRQLGKIALCGQPLDLRRVDVPALVVATREDQIVPWRSAYTSSRLLTGRIEFLLGASGHIAGIVNPPDAKRREYWLSDTMADSADESLAQARRAPGSWWPHWVQWLKRWAGELTIAPQALSNAQYPPLE